MELPQFNTQTLVYFYTRSELLSLRTMTSLLRFSTVVRLKDLYIGCHLPRRHRSSRGKKEVRTEVASSRPDHLPTLSIAKTSELSLLVKSP